MGNPRIEALKAELRWFIHCPKESLALQAKARIAQILVWALALPLFGCGPSFAQWQSREIIDAFESAGLDVQDLRVLTDEDYGSAPAVAREGISFVIPAGCPCDDGAARVFSFASRPDLNQMRAYHEERARDLYSVRVFVKDNILMMITGDLPEAEAKEYERILNDLE